MKRLLLAAVTVAAWAPALRGSFHYDDLANVVMDPATSELSALLERLLTGVRPLLRLSYFLDHAIWGMHATGFLATNLALHVATALGVFAFARERLESEDAALAAGLVFALQPANAEVVAWVSGRSTGLMAALAIWALVAWQRRRAGLALGLFVAACLAKEVALVLPLLVLVLDRRPRVAWVSAAIAVVGLLALSPRYRELAEYSLSLRAPLESLGANLAAFPSLVSLWVRPWALTVDHAFDATSWRAIDAVLGALLVAAFIAGALQKKYASLALACAWVLLALAPTQSFVAKLDVVTEKPLYFAWIGPSLFLGGLLASRRRVQLSLAAALSCVCLWRAFTWSDPVRLWAEATRAAPANARAWKNLGSASLATQDYESAILALERATELDPDDGQAAETLRLARSLAQ